jgi:hypothetical protein
LERAPERSLPEALGEIVWPEFFREVTRLYPWVGSATRRGFATRIEHFRLRAPQTRELARRLGQYEMTVRYALTGCRLIKDRIELNAGVREWLEELAAAQNRRRTMA